MADRCPANTDQTHAEQAPATTPAQHVHQTLNLRRPVRAAARTRAAAGRKRSTDIPIDWDIFSAAKGRKRRGARATHTRVLLCWIPCLALEALNTLLLRLPFLEVAENPVVMQQQGQTSLHPPEHQPSPQPAQVDWREWLGFMDQIQQRKEKSKRITVDDTTGKVHLYAGQDHEIMVAGPSTNYTLGGSAFALALLLVVTVGFFVRFLFDSPNLGEISKEADSTSSWTLPDVAITVAAAVDQASFCKCITSAVERYHHISYVFVVITKRRNNCEQLDK